MVDGTVTGTYRTSEAEVVAVHLDGLAEPIAATPSHPFWSIDRDDWTPAGELLPGETIGTYDGHATVVAIIPRRTTTTVYNLEVYGAHTYFVSAAKAWVHNTCRVLQTGGHTITEATRRALGLTREQAKKAMEGLKEIIGEGAADHGHKIWSNGDVTNSHTGELLGNLRDFL